MANLSGQEIRGYVLREQIGSGGFAAVYRAFQTAVDREVAIKIILPKYANNPDFVRRFETEAQLIARLEHIHIVPLYDFWREPNNAYLVMRWLRGGTLAKSIRARGAWGLQSTARLLDQIAAALMAAHRHGVVHQDLSPANILLDEMQNGYLADFGIARDIVKAAQPNEPVYGTPAYMAPERIRHEPATPQSDIYSLGIVLYELLTGRFPFQGTTSTTVLSKHLTEPLPPLQEIRPDLPSSFNYVILQATAKSPQSRYANPLLMAAEFRQIVQTDTAGLVESLTGTGGAGQAITGSETIELLPPQTVDLRPDVELQNPYKGLRAFDEADASTFFGRHSLIRRLLDRMGETGTMARFLAVVGPSGSGKSSVVRAGLIPALRRDELPDSFRWFYAKMVPGVQPFEELANALLGVAFQEFSEMGARLRQDERGLLEVVQRILPDDETDLVLTIDQFEEIFTLVTDESERDLFLRSLLVATTEPGSRLRVIITLRADFYDRPLMFSGFGQLVRERTEVVLPLTPAELEEAIVRPASRAHLTLEQGLVAEIIADVSAQAGSLPLLQYALTELFERRDDHTLTMAAYHSSGGVLGALARRAEELYAGMDGIHQAAARQVFLRLIGLGEGTENTRRRARWAELISLGGQDPASLQDVLDTFGKFRLLTFDRNPQTREPTVEIAHEALIRQWDRLRGWLDENREALRVHRRLAANAAEWIGQGRHPSYLAAGTRLAQFEALQISRAVALNEDEQAYLAAGIAQRQRAARRLRLFVAVLALLTLASISLAGYALDRQRRERHAREQAQQAEAEAVAERIRADQEAQVASSRALAATALTKTTQADDLALLLSLAALNEADTFEARSGLLTALQSVPYLSALLHDHTAEIRCIALNPAGTLLASGDASGAVLVADVRRRAVIFRLKAAEGDQINSVAFSPDGQRLAAGTSSGTILRWDLDSGQPVGDPITGHTDAVWSVAFSPDGKHLASASADMTVRRWDAVTGEPVGEPLAGHTDYVFSVTYGGRVIASGGADQTIRLWDATTGEPLGDPLTGHTDWVWSLAFSPDGKTLVSGSADRTVRRWDAVTGEPLGDPLAGHTDRVRSVAFSADGQQIVSTGWDGTVRLWDAATGQPGPAMKGQEDEWLWGVAAGPDGMVAAGGRQGTVSIWDVHTPFPIQQRLEGHLDSVEAVAFSPDGGRLASGGGASSGSGGDNRVRLWDIAEGRELAAMDGHTGTVTGLAFSPDGRVLASVGADGTLRLWDGVTGDALREPLLGRSAVIRAVAFSPDGALLTAGSDDGVIVLWDTAAEQVAGELRVDDGSGVYTLAFSPDGQLLASGHLDQRIYLWRMADRQPAREPLAGHTDVVTSVAFSPDGRLLASSSRDNTIILWDTTTWQPLRAPLQGHSNWVLSLSFIPGTSWLASGSRDETILLWDTAIGLAAGLPLAGHQGWVTSVSVSPDGGLMASSGRDGTILLWRVGLEDWRHRACDLANRSLTGDEWAYYVGGGPPQPVCPLPE